MKGLKLVETAELKGVRGEEVGGGGEEEGSKVSKVYEKESAFYLSWFKLEHNLKFKIVCASSGQTAEAIALSRSLVQLLRWQLPSSLLAYNYYDGSVAIDDVAAYLKVETGLIFAARSARAGAGKMRTLVFSRVHATL